MSEEEQEPGSLLRVLTATATVAGPDAAKTIPAEAPGRFCQNAGMLGDSSCAVPGVDRALLESSRRGLAALSGVFAAVIVSGVTLTTLLRDLLHWPLPATSGLDVLRQLVLVVLSAGMFLVTRAPSIGDERVLRLGYAYQLLGAAVISLTIYGAGLNTGLPAAFVSWLAAWILLFPLVAPAPPRTAIALSLACAATVPLSLTLGTLMRGDELPTLATLVRVGLPYVFCAGLALVPALTLQRLSSGLSEFRDTIHDLGTYRLVEELGAGGMGVVWRAEHRMLQRPAAIKVIKPSQVEGSTPAERETAAARFEREAATTAALRSPHTVELYDFGVTADRSFYYVMELLDGVDLDDLVRNHGPLPPARVVYILRQICLSLAEAHAHCTVHRDLKPANVMVCRMGIQTDFVKVLDFGLVRSLRRTPQSVTLTGDHTIVGTPAFMSPEQGEGGEVDARSDLYSLGCVAYWLLTGKLVFEESKPVPMIVAHASRTPVPPSEKRGEPIPEQLEALVMALLSKSPADRPQSAEALAEQLADCALEDSWDGKDARAWWNEHAPHDAEAQPAFDPDRTVTRLAV